METFQELPSNVPREDKRFSKFTILEKVMLVLLIALTSFLVYTIISHQREIEVLNRQIYFKRINENQLGKMMRPDVVLYEQGAHVYLPHHALQLEKFYKSKNISSLADFGCGRCEYILDLADKLNIEVEGFDTAPYANDSRIHKMDLSQFTPLNRTFDYVQSFEVGEHIFSDKEDNFIRNIATHAKRGILLSWGVVGQGGLLHVNNRPREYIRMKIQKYGFKQDKKATSSWKDFYDGFTVYERE